MDGACSVFDFLSFFISKTIINDVNFWHYRLLWLIILHDKLVINLLLSSVFACIDDITTLYIEHVRLLHLVFVWGRLIVLVIKLL